MADRTFASEQRGDASLADSWSQAQAGTHKMRPPLGHRHILCFLLTASRAPLTYRGDIVRWNEQNFQSSVSHCDIMPPTGPRRRKPRRRRMAASLRTRGPRTRKEQRWKTRALGVRDKYQLNLLNELNELPTLRNEIHFYRNQRSSKEKKPPRVKPVPFMCDVCQVFTKSAFELNEHLMGEEHRVALKKFLVGGQSTTAGSAADQPSQPDVDPTKEPQKPELYCNACQLLLPSLGAKREHEKGKKHKFLQELRKGMKTESHTQEGLATAAQGGGSNREEVRPKEETPLKSVHCSLCMVDVESEAAMKEQNQISLM
ncbi:hypothetical protein V5799_024464 [Amblyomma americanum]|uniref:Uncharacterized protein n=1 Tax=Amblyomma americanum TaxID=6943 RepID=A0AAQ4EC87_AMBAM